MASHPHAEPITRSFELAAERCPDLTPQVYERLFREHPRMRELFVLDADQSVRGSMLEWAIRSILDLLDSRQYGLNLILAEAVNHHRNGVAIGEFPIFFHILAASLRELLGSDWSPDIDAAWRGLLTELDEAVSRAQA